MDPTRAFRPGLHLLADLHGARHLADARRVEAALREAAARAGATLLACHVHGFPSAGGVTGVALLAESHITIHTWPELGFAAVDVFMCGEARPEAAVEAIREALGAARAEVTRAPRGAGYSNPAPQPAP